jgi:hypothetical protein
MPYSSDKFCVSPSSVGNYADKCSAPVIDENAGSRCLTTLCSWAMGGNRIYQTVSLAKGTYRLLIDMRYTCTNQLENKGSQITTSSNTNTSLTGLSINGTSDYRYPSEKNTWQTMCYDFNIDNAQEDVEISLGFSTSASVGAASNTLMYADNVRLLKKILLGDANGDGTVNVADIINIIGFLLGERDDINKDNADINADNTINFTDMVSIINMLLI